MGQGGMSLVELIHACREETLTFMRREGMHDVACLELFRRAVVERNEGAWEAIFTQYRGIVHAWVRGHPAGYHAGEDTEHWVGRAFERFWRAVGPERFADFSGVAPLLRYLKMCVHSVLTDEARSQRWAQIAPLTENLRGNAPDIADATASRDTAASLWQTIVAETRDAAEERVAYLCFVLGLKPGEVVAQEPNLFASVGDVYRIKRNLIERLRRNPAVREFLA